MRDGSAALGPGVRALNLGLQGGGSHGAFTWGVLDTLLQDERLEFAAISGTSAGALNAVVLASGWATAEARGQPPRQGAREALRRMWDDIGLLGTYGAVQRPFLQPFAGLAFAHPAARTALPFNPLRPLLAQWIDFDAVQSAQRPAVHVSATAVRSGRAVIFTASRLTPDAVLASACLPALFPPVLIDGEPYWDGGFSVNPPLSPFLGGGPQDVLLVQINPIRRLAVPATGADIDERVDELMFNAGLLSQMRAVDHLNQLVALGLFPADRRIFMHRIDGGAGLAAYPPASRAQAHATLVRELFALGRQAASAWLQRHADDLGRRSTLDFADYADDTWLQLAASAQAARGARRLQGDAFDSFCGPLPGGLRR